MIVGWVLGSQQPDSGGGTAAPPAASQTTSSTESAPPLIDEARVQALRTVAENDPGNVEVRVQLANLYYDGERYDLAAPWYESALALNANDADVSTDLGVCYYQDGQIDRALAQFDHSLGVDPRHVKTLLNVGIVLAFGKQDLAAATQAWERVIEVAPASQEADIARRALESLSAAHQGLGTAE